MLEVMFFVEKLSIIQNMRYPISVYVILFETEITESIDLHLLIAESLLQLAKLYSRATVDQIRQTKRQKRLSLAIKLIQVKH